MLNLILNSLTRLLPHASVAEDSPPWSGEDSSWHSSSFELARGLEVIELRDPPPTVFADTMPACHPPPTQGMMAPGSGNATRS